MYLPDVRIELFLFLRTVNLIVINEKDRQKNKHSQILFEWLLAVHKKKINFFLIPNYIE